MIKIKIKSLSYLAVVLLLISGLATLTAGTQATTTQSKTINVAYATPTASLTTINDQTYTQINIQGADNSFISTGAPAVPMTITTLEFPLGTIITNVQVTPKDILTGTLTYPIAPSPTAVIDDGNAPNTVFVDSAYYSSTDFYPATWFTYSTGGGLNANGVHTTFLVIHTYPVRVSPATNTMQYAQQATITVQYQDPQQPKTFGAGPQMVIIAPKEFTSTLQKLVDHKNSKGITTSIMTTEDIYAQYPQGVDKPESIKLAIKDAVDNGAKYILLAGGRNNYLFGAGGRDTNCTGITGWFVPVRYAMIDEGGTEADHGLISDLYYADIYNANGTFCSWDSNHDGVYGKWKKGVGGKDKLDLYPDVAVSRLPARSAKELATLIDKIITYESSPLDPAWFMKEVLVGGDSFDDTQMANINEGEVSTDYSHNESLPEFTPIRLFSSNKDIAPDYTPTPTNIAREISSGCGFLHFDGHGNPVSWNTHWHDQFNWTRGNSPGGLNAWKMPQFTNKEKLPVCIVGGCHNSMINTSFFWTLNSKNTATWTYGQPTLRSWSEMMLAVKNGGAIACMGNTGLGYGLVGMGEDGQPACYQGLGGFIERTFLQGYHNATVKTLGNCWVEAMNRYQNVYPGMGDQADAKTMEEWISLGDPSLMIGGYS